MCKATYQRLMNTWKQYSRTVRKLLLANIKADVSALLVGDRVQVQRESTALVEITDGDEYAE